MDDLGFEFDCGELDEIQDEVYKELAAEEKRIKDEVYLNLDIFKSNIDYDFELADEYLCVDDDGLNYFEHIGFVEVKKSDFKNGFNPSKEYYEIIGDDSDELKYGIQDTSEEHTFHALVYQTTGYCEDDYSGFILLPMKDGKYWKIRYWS